MSVVYLFYKISSYNTTPSLYAFTSTKAYKDRFVQERNMKRFLMKKEKMSDTEFSELLMNHHMNKLVEIPLNYEDRDYVTMIGTEMEEGVLTGTADIIQEAMQAANEYFAYVEDSGNPLKKKYHDAIQDMTTTSYAIKEDGGRMTINSTINMFHIFYSLFKDKSL